MSPQNGTDIDASWNIKIMWSFLNCVVTFQCSARTEISG